MEGRGIHLTSSYYNRLLDAITSNDIKAVKAALDAGANPNELPLFEDEPMAPLCVAAADGKLEIVRLLLDRGAEVNCSDGWSTPLEAAATNDQIKCMELLIRRGAVVNNYRNGGSYTLYRAAVEGKIEAVKFLLAHGANPNTTFDKDTLLKIVETCGQKKVAALLRKAGAK